MQPGARFTPSTEKPIVHAGASLNDTPPCLHPVHGHALPRQFPSTLRLPGPSGRVPPPPPHTHLPPPHPNTHPHTTTTSPPHPTCHHVYEFDVVQRAVHDGFVPQFVLANAGAEVLRKGREQF